MAKNTVNANFNQIAVTDASDNVYGIRAAVANVQITGSTTAGQVLTATAVDGALQWTTPAASSTWTTSTVTITATTTNPTKSATPTRDQLRYRKVGDKIYHLQLSYQQATGGTAGNGIYLFTLPAGLQFDLTRQTVNTNGNAGALAAASYPARITGGSGMIWSAASTAVMMPVAYDATRFYLSTIGGSGGATYGFIHNNTYFNYAADIWVDVDFIFTATT